ncbi:hypothetical protein, partial [Nocardia tengchongensis]|uniref:hypothetical protein n=1 Tax=Nocardia tengchongensis TaxID=2055889 RepID=UPI00360A669E
MWPDGPREASWPGAGMRSTPVPPSLEKLRGVVTGQGGLRAVMADHDGALVPGRPGLRILM